jgi:hypothetical protein
MWFNLLKPLGILFVISGSVSLVFSENSLTFIKLFLFSSIIQIILYDIYKRILSIYAERIKNERIKEFSKQGMEVKCPCYLEKKMFVPITLNSDNYYKCLECKKDVSVEIQTKTFLKTEIMDLDNAELAISEVYKKLQEKP